MKTSQLVVAGLWVVLFGGGGLAVQSLVNDNPSTDQLIAGGLWGMFCITLYFSTHFQLKARRLEKEVEHVTNAVANTDKIAKDVIDMQDTLLQLFCIVYTPDEQSVPDTRYYPAWKTKLFEENDGLHGVLLQLRKGVCPILPQLGTVNPLPLTARQEQAIARYLRKRARLSAVR